MFDFAVLDPVVVPVSHEAHDLELRELTNMWPQNLPELRLCFLLLFVYLFSVVNYVMN